MPVNHTPELRNAGSNILNPYKKIAGLTIQQYKQNLRELQHIEKDNPYLIDPIQITNKGLEKLYLNTKKLTQPKRNGTSMDSPF